MTRSIFNSDASLFIYCLFIYLFCSHLCFLIIFLSSVLFFPFSRFSQKYIFLHFLSYSILFPQIILLFLFITLHNTTINQYLSKLHFNIIIFPIYFHILFTIVIKLFLSHITLSSALYYHINISLTSFSLSIMYSSPFPLIFSFSHSFLTIF